MQLNHNLVLYVKKIITSKIDERPIASSSKNIKQPYQDSQSQKRRLARNQTYTPYYLGKEI